MGPDAAKEAYAAVAKLVANPKTPALFVEWLDATQSYRDPQAWAAIARACELRETHKAVKAGGLTLDSLAAGLR